MLHQSEGYPNELIEANNIDEILTREVDHSVHPDRFLDDDTDAEEVDAATAEVDNPEPTEDESEPVPHEPATRTVRTTVTHPLAVAIMQETPQTIPQRFTWGAMTGKFLPEAHASGEALRTLRRQRRPIAHTEVVPAPLPVEVAQCDRWTHARDCEHKRAAEASGYYEAIADAVSALKGGKPVVAGPDEWREVPGSEGRYLMNGATRQIWRSAYVVDLPNGSQRRYEAKVLTPRNGSYSLSIGGRNISRGCNALWAEIFSERATKRRQPGQWDDTIAPKNDPYLADGIGEWMASGGVEVE